MSLGKATENCMSVCNKALFYRLSRRYFPWGRYQTGKENRDEANSFGKSTNHKGGRPVTVKQIQHLLAFLGYYTASVDGIAGAQTAAAIRAFQKAFGGLDVDGIAGEKTQQALRKAVWEGMPQQPAEDSGDSTFWNRVRYFRREEFRCQCGGRYCRGFPAEPKEALVLAGEQIREHFGVPVTVSSGVRCPRHNADVGGVINSKHLSGKAMDFSPAGVKAQTVLAYVRQLSQISYSYAIDENYVHIELR